MGHLIDTLWYLATLLLKVDLVGLPNVLALALHHNSWYRTILLLKVRVLFEHVELPHVLDLAVHRSIFWLDEPRGSF